ncbi:MAG: ComEA family DNA-binding protein [Gemmatimonadales bacterium]
MKRFSQLLSGISPRERRALVVLLGLGVAGHLLRTLAAQPAAPPIAAQLFDPASDGDPLAHRDSIRRQGQPLGANERIDPDVAGAGDLMRLPGIGPALARRIVADRQSHGAFGGLSGLQRVKGIGAVLLGRIAPHLSFKGVPAEAEVVHLPDTVDLNLATAAELAGLPGIGPKRARAIIAFRDSAGPFRQLSDLKKVKGITSAVLRAIDGRLVVP